MYNLQLASLPALQYSHSREVPLYVVGTRELLEVHRSRLNNVFQKTNSNQYRMSQKNVWKVNQA